MYVTAGIGVVYDPSSNKQRFYFDHTDDVLWYIYYLLRLLIIYFAIVFYLGH